MPPQQYGVLLSRTRGCGALISCKSILPSPPSTAIHCHPHRVSPIIHHSLSSLSGECPLSSVIHHLLSSDIHHSSGLTRAKTRSRSCTSHQKALKSVSGAGFGCKLQYFARWIRI